MNPKETRLLPCALSDQDIKSSLAELETLTANVRRIDELEAGYRNEIQLARAYNATQTKKVTREIQKRIGLRPVECEVRSNFAKAHLEIVRIDTGKVVEVVPMTASQAAGEVHPTAYAEATSEGQTHADVLEGKA